MCRKHRYQIIRDNHSWRVYGVHWYKCGYCGALTAVGRESIQKLVSGVVWSDSFKKY